MQSVRAKVTTKRYQSYIRSFLQRFSHAKVELFVDTTFDQSDNIDRFKDINDNACPSSAREAVYDFGGFLPSLLRIGTLEMF